MKSIAINQQKPADKVWKDEAGMPIPFNRLTPFEKKAERTVAKLAKDALEVHNRLADFKQQMRDAATELYNLFLKENDGKVGKNKGNVTLFNFDRSIKLEVKINDRIELDPNFINLAKAELDIMIEGLTKDAQNAVQVLLQTAFETSGGSLDVKKILSLKKHTSRFNNNHWNKAMEHIDKSIRNPSSKEYFRVWVKSDDGQYRDIQLNFSAIELEDSDEQV